MNTVLRSMATVVLAAQLSASSGSAADNLFCVNNIVRSVVALNGVDPVFATRLYALNAIAQHEIHHRLLQKPTAESKESIRSFFAIAASRAAYRLVSLELGPGAASVEGLDWSSCAPQRDGDKIEEAGRLGLAIIDTLLENRGQDGSHDISPVHVPDGSAAWISFQNRPPVRPRWGEVRPLVVADIEAYVAPPPPEVGTLEFGKQLLAVEQQSWEPSARSRSIVQKWSDATGTQTPAGHWLQIAEHALLPVLGDELKLRVLGLVAIAMHDAAIACWRAKYRYWYPRPSQMNPQIRPLISVPNFPAYTSGHSTMSGAAMIILSEFLPSQADEYSRLASEASYSRIMAGIHYPADSETGLEQGISIGRAVLQSIAPDRSLMSQVR